MNKNKVFIFQPTIPGWLRWPEPMSAARGARQTPSLDRTPFHHRAHSRTYLHSLKLGQVRQASSPKVHGFGM